jgi:hypothetical protein
MTRKRLALGVLALAALAVSAGCTGPFGGGVSDERLDENATYEWNASADVYVNVTGPEFHAVYDVSGFEGAEFEIWQPGIDGRNPRPVSAVRYRYPNGTVVTGSELTVETRGGATVVELPESDGQLAFTAPAGSKRLTLPSYMAGSYHVVLPANTRAGFPLFGRIAPGADDTAIDEDSNRVHLEWNDLSRTLNVQWYLERDIWLFGGLVAILGAIAIVGVSYYVYQIRRLEREREELGLDVADDDDGRDPPPGMG